LTFRRSLCPQCRKKFTPQEKAARRLIHPECIDAYAEATQARAERDAEKERKAKQRVEKSLDRKKRQEQKRIPDLIKEAQTAFNAFIRERDHDQPCICCGKPLGADAPGGGYDCGHYRSTGSASHLRFDERNAHAQRKHCNRYGAGRAVDYRIGLIERLGMEAVEALESNNEPHKWQREELIAIKAEYVKRLRELKRGAV